MAHAAVRVVVHGLLAAALLAPCAGCVRAADIKVLCPGAVRSIVTELGAEFARDTGDKVQFEFGTAGGLQKRAAAGDAADVIIATAAGIDALAKLGPVIEGTRTDLGKVGVGVAVRAGAPLPDVSTPQAFRQAMLDAKSILYADPAFGGQSGIHTAKVFEQLGIAEQLKAKTVLVPGAPEGLPRVASGEIEIGIGQVSELRAAKGLAFAGPFPPALQNALTFSAGIMRKSADPDAARAFVAYLAGARARALFEQRGFEAP